MSSNLIHFVENATREEMIMCENDVVICGG
jgi:hypothetical protein